MADTVTFKDLKSLEKLDERVRYRVDPHGVVSIPDAKANNWLQVREGDKIERYGDGYTIVPGDK